MRSKVLILIGALAFGAVAAIAAVLYVGTARKAAEAQDRTVQVLVAAQDIPRGMAVNDILAAGLVAPKEVPRKYIAAGAISTTRTLDGRVLADSVSKGEQLTQSRFEYPSTAGLAFTVPKGLLAVSIPYTETRGVGGLVKPGDSVAVVVTIEGGTDQEATTRILIPKAKVLALGQNVSTGGAVDGGTTTLQTGNQQAQPAPQGKAASVTLALAPTDVEKLVFAQENARVWLSLLSPDGTEPGVTTGETQKTLFAR
jgi:Flp pilus assembly protein CpaB